MPIDWNDLVPPEVADRQRQWERLHRCARARDVGLKYREIADLYGFSLTRAQQLVVQGTRREVSPVERYLNGGDIVHLTEFRPGRRRGRKQRNEPIGPAGARLLIQTIFADLLNRPAATATSHVEVIDMLMGE